MRCIRARDRVAQPGSPAFVRFREIFRYSSQRGSTNRLEVTLARHARLSLFIM